MASSDRISTDPRLDRAFLDAHGFDAARFDAEATRIKAGDLTKASSVITASIEPTPETKPCSRTPEAETAGRAALEAGKIAVVVLNGGMATRFGGVVKGTVEVFDGSSFIGLKALGVKLAGERYGKRPALVLMNSFATGPETAAHLEEHGRFGLEEDDIMTFEQTISVRLTPEGDVFEVDGAPSYHAPGHGDFFPCIRSSGVLERLRDRGFEHVLFSNVDNLGATLDPVVVGHHVASGAAMTVEVTEKRKSADGQWDKGGAPASVDGFTQIVEGFRFPSDFEQEILPDFSTNTFHFRLADLDQEIMLPRHVVEKTVDDRPALQMESIACEASAVRSASGDRLLSLQLLRVDRDGPRGRFFPIKEPSDLDASRDALKARLENE